MRYYQTQPPTDELVEICVQCRKSYRKERNVRRGEQTCSPDCRAAFHRAKARERLAKARDVLENSFEVAWVEDGDNTQTFTVRILNEPALRVVAGYAGFTGDDAVQQYIHRFFHQMNVEHHGQVGKALTQAARQLAEETRRLTP